jgi:hypothetical protein
MKRSGNTERGSAGADSVADEQWRRVRALASTVARLEAQEAEGGLDDDGEIRLARARLRAARATERALLADEIADRLAALRPRPQGSSVASRKSAC